MKKKTPSSDFIKMPDARTDAEVCAAVSFWCYWKRCKEKECPDERRVSPRDLISEAEEFPVPKILEVGQLLKELYGRPDVMWLSDGCGDTLAVKITIEPDPACQELLFVRPPEAFREEHVASMVETHRRWLAIPKEKRPRPSRSSLW